MSSLAAALEVVGARWALLIVDRLLDGPQRYGDLQRDLGVPTNILATRLRELEAENAKLRAASGLVDYAPGKRYLVKLKDAVSWVVEPAPGEHPYDTFRRVTGVLASTSQPEVSPTDLPIGRA